MSSQRKILLYTTLGCHLCEQAAELMQPALDTFGFSLREVEIADSEAHYQRYALSIPVVQDAASGVELYWPFDREDFRHWLEQVSAHSQAEE